MAVELAEVAPHLVLYIQVEGVTHTVARNHPRSHCKDTRVLHIGCNGINLIDDRLYLFFVFGSFIPVLQTDNEHTGRITLTGNQPITGGAGEVFQSRKRFQTLAKLIHNLVRRGQRATRRSGYIDQYHALVFVGYKPGLSIVHQEHQQNHRSNQQAPCEPTTLDEEQYTVLVFVYHRREGGIECLTETGSKVILFCTVFVDIRFQQQGTESRTQRQGIDGRDTYRNGHCQTELGVEGTGCTTHE